MHNAEQDGAQELQRKIGTDWNLKRIRSNLED